MKNDIEIHNLLDEITYRYDGSENMYDESETQYDESANIECTKREFEYHTMN